MSELIKMVTSQLDAGTISKLGEQLGLDSNQVATAVSARLPLMLKALAKNTEGGGADALAGALDKDHDGSILDNIGDYVGGSGVDLSQGAAILGHVLGSKQNVVSAGIGKAAGLDAGSAGQVMSAMAPLLMGALGKQHASGGLDASALTSLLGAEQKAAEDTDPDAMGMLGQLLDTDDDGDVSDDLMNIGGRLLGSFLSR